MAVRSCRTSLKINHEFYTFIRANDSAAKVAIGAIVQPSPSPLRLAYCDVRPAINCLVFWHTWHTVGPVCSTRGHLQGTFALLAPAPWSFPTRLNL
jgi:hypothetical protein